LKIKKTAPLRLTKTKALTRKPPPRARARTRARARARSRDFVVEEERISPRQPPKRQGRQQARGGG
jgi:hypothetical protein